MSKFALFWVFTWLLGSPAGRLMLLVLLLWYLDYRYLGLLAALWAPVVRWQRLAGLRHAVEVNPSDVRAMVEVGEIYLQGNNPRAAAEYLEQALARGEDSARATYLLGAARVRLGQYEEGRKLLEAALAKEPRVAYGEPYLYLLEAAFATEGPAAPRVEELVAELEPFDSVEVLTRAGRLCGAAGRTDLARRLLTDAIRNYDYTPKPLRRRQRRWLVRARLGLLGLR